MAGGGAGGRRASYRGGDVAWQLDLKKKKKKKKKVMVGGDGEKFSNVVGQRKVASCWAAAELADS